MIEWLVTEDLRLEKTIVLQGYYKWLVDVLAKSTHPEFDNCVEMLNELLVLGDNIYNNEALTFVASDLDLLYIYVKEDIRYDGNFQILLDEKISFLKENNIKGVKQSSAFLFCMRKNDIEKSNKNLIRERISQND